MKQTKRLSKSQTEVLFKRLHGLVNRGGDQWMARCPAHADTKASLSVKRNPDGTSVIYCHAECSFEAIIAAVPLDLSDPYPQSDDNGRETARPVTRKPKQKRIWRSPKAFAATQPGKSTGYKYTDAAGKPYAYVIRFDLGPGSKTFRPMHRNGDGWSVGDPPGKLPLYRLPTLKEADRVYILEGEGCVKRARKLELTATTSAHGSNYARRTDWSPLRGAAVVILPDNDNPGRKYADAVARILLELDPAARVKVVELPDLPKGGDIAEYVEGLPEGTDIKANIEALADKTEPYQVPEGKHETSEGDNNELEKYSEFWTAREILRLSGQDIRHSDGHGWIIWDGTRWQRDRLSGVEAAYQRMVGDVYRRLNDRTDPDQAGLTAHALTLLRHKRLRDTLGWLKVLPSVRLLDSELETKLYLWNFKNGTMDLKTGILQKHEREDMLLKRSDVVYDEHAKCRRFRKFMDETFRGNIELIAYVMRIFGIAMLGKVLDHALYVFLGDGANGKTTLTNIVLAAFGGYGMQGSSKMLLKKRYESHTTDLAQLHGVRLVVCSETGKGAKMDVERVKMLTGGDSIRARYMRQDEFEFKPSHSVVLHTNDAPEIPDQGLAIWRRIKLVQFAHTVPKNKQDPNLVAKIVKSELPGIVAWMVRGCMDAQKNGMQEPITVVNATEKYKTSEDTITEFMDECCHEGKHEIVSKDDLYRELETHTGKPCPLSKKAFGITMKKRGYGEAHRTIDGKKKRVWVGVGLLIDGDGQEALRANIRFRGHG